MNLIKPFKPLHTYYKVDTHSIFILNGATECKF